MVKPYNRYMVKMLYANALYNIETSGKGLGRGYGMGIGYRGCGENNGSGHYGRSAYRIYIFSLNLRSNPPFYPSEAALEKCHE